MAKQWCISMTKKVVQNIGCSRIDLTLNSSKDTIDELITALDKGSAVA